MVVLYSLKSYFLFYILFLNSNKDESNHFFIATEKINKPNALWGKGVKMSACATEVQTDNDGRVIGLTVSYNNGADTFITRYGVHWYEDEPGLIPRLTWCTCENVFDRHLPSENDQRIMDRCAHDKIGEKKEGATPA